MSRKRFRWNRANYRKARHLSRLLCQLRDVYSPPPLVEEYHRLWADWNARHHYGRDPLSESTAQRLAYMRDEVPF